MTDPTVAEVQIAKTLAEWHGAQILHRHDGTTHTVASSRLHSSHPGWHERNLPAYVDRFWREYLGAARAMIQFRSQF